MKSVALRSACAAVLLIAVMPVIAVAQTLTAAEAIHRIQQHYPVAPPANTVDTVKCG